MVREYTSTFEKQVYIAWVYKNFLIVVVYHFWMYTTVKTEVACA